MKKFILSIIFILSLSLHFGGNGIEISSSQVLMAQQGNCTWKCNHGGFFSWLKTAFSNIGTAVENVANEIGKFFKAKEGEGNTNEGEEFGNETGSENWYEPSGSPEDFYSPAEDPWFQPEGFGQEEWDIFNNLDYWYASYVNGGNPPTQDCNGIWGGTAYLASCGCIGGTTGIASCPPCNLTINNIIISIDNAECKPAESVTLSTNITKTGSGATGVIFEWEASYNDGAWKYLEDGVGNLNSGTCNNFIYQMRVLGKVSFRLKIQYVCDGVTLPSVYSNTVNCLSKYCATDLQSSYASQISSDWSNTVSSHMSNPNLKYEYGFSLDFKGSNLTYETSTFNVSASCGTSVVGNSFNSYEPTAAAISSPNSNIVKFGGTWTVGAFHTHPTVTNCPSGGSDCYNPGPSSIDNGQAASSPKFPRVVRTYSSYICGGHSSSLPFQDYSFSSTCTTY
jgi:hypothetical protein